jgi:hypothetical protein
MIIYENPANGYQAKFTKLSYLWSFLFGWMYFAFKGSFFWAFITFILSFLTIGLSWIIVPFFTRPILDNIYGKKGWVKISS